MKYNGFEIPDNEVDKMVDALECSIAEACEVWLADHYKIVDVGQEELDKEAKKNNRRYEKSEKPRKKTEKVRKIDFEKGFLLEIMRKALENEANIEDFWIKTETELYFTYNNNKYTVKLTKHRPKK
jgi:hypothetical protein